jgi:hypothetical protein
VNWEQVIKKVTPYIFKIETPAGNGTGFLYIYNDDKAFCGVATALHVIDYANTWKQPIRLTHHSSSEILFLSESQYIIFADWKTDSAVIFFQKPTFQLPGELIELIPGDQPLGIGNEVSWLGFPAIEPYTLCFFSGNISAWQNVRKAYLIDGVAINGVSGGPVTYLHGTDDVKVVGIVSAYRANRVTGDTLPGLLYAQDVSHFHDVIRAIRSIDDANKKKQEIDQQQQAEKGLKQQAIEVDAEKLRTR